jgi:succinate dehydrogenase/fumarate reductase flavoprotein subunit
MNKEEYIETVLENIYADDNILKRIEEDLNERIDMAIDSDPYLDIIEEMGTPKDVAKEFMENLDIDQSKYVRETTKFTAGVYEYKSKGTLFGVPLIHVNTGGKFKQKTARGIVAVGDIAIGVVSIGGVSLGVFSLGGISLGGFVVGGVAIGGFAVGGVAIGLFAIGGVAISVFKAFGALPLILR